MRLHHTIGLWKVSEAARQGKHSTAVWEERATRGLPTQAISLKRVGNATSMLYASPIAHQLAPEPHHAVDIAAQLADSLRLALSSDPEPFLQGVTVNETTTGFIQFEIGDRAIAAWLDLLLADGSPQPPLPTARLSETERQLMLQAPDLFEAQHAHARCCSLLRLAHREGFIHLEKLEESPQNWRFCSPATVAWLTSTDQLCFQHPADHALLAQLFDAHDHLFDPSQRQTQASVLRSAQAVAHAFQAFHRAHPLWERAQEDSSLTVARLGLLMITQRVLHLLLWDGLHLCPAVEL